MAKERNIFQTNLKKLQIVAQNQIKVTENLKKDAKKDVWRNQEKAAYLFSPLGREF